ncbi:MAG TPA: efflux RND transporter periplasmic adaptor subunit [Coleofasciculaceae cyanobacterium]
MTNQVPDQEQSQLNGAAKVAKSAFEEQDLEPLSLPEKDKASRNWLSGGRSLAIGIGIGVVLAVGGMRLLGAQPTNAPAKKAPTTTTPSSAPAQSVTVATVETTDVDQTLRNISGSVAAFEMIPVSPQATGLQIKEVLVDEGDFVKAGQVMARLDDAVLQAQLTQAKASAAQAEARLAELRTGTRKEEIARSQARLEQAEARLRESQASIPRQIEQAEAQVASAQARLNLAENRYKSYQSLVEQGAVTKDRFNEAVSDYRSAQASLAEAQQRLAQSRNTNNPEIDQLAAAVAEAKQELSQLKAGSRPEAIAQAEAQLAQAQGQVQAVTAQLEDTQVFAPASGKVAERNARVGDVSSPSTKLFTIIQNGRLELLLKVTENQLKQIRTGQSVKITSNKDSNLNLTGKVREIDPMVDEQSRQAIVKVDLPTSASLKPGMFLQGTITTSAAKGLTVPSKAVLPQANGSAIVYKLQGDGTVKAQPVQMGEIMSGERVEIKSGLSAGDRIVVKGAPFLKDGDKVEVRS